MRFAPLFAVLPLAGCYSYVPTRLQDVPPGSPVRAYLAPAATASLQSRMGLSGGALSGRLEQLSQDQVVFLVRSPGTGTQPGAAVLYQRVDVAAPDVARVDVRVLSKLRTGGVVAALLGAATVWAVRAFRGGHAGGQDNQPPPPVE